MKPLPPFILTVLRSEETPEGTVTELQLSPPSVDLYIMLPTVAPLPEL